MLNYILIITTILIKYTYFYKIDLSLWVIYFYVFGPYFALIRYSNFIRYGYIFISFTRVQCWFFSAKIFLTHLNYTTLRLDLITRPEDVSVSKSKFCDLNRSLPAKLRWTYARCDIPHLNRRIYTTG